MSGQSVHQLWEGWNPPAMLSGSTPRPIKPTASGIWSALVGVPVALAIAAGGISGVAEWVTLVRRQAADVRRMQAKGQVTEGVVTGLWTLAESAVGRSEGYMAAYNFKLGSRTYYNGGVALAPDHWRALRVGSPIAVRYLASDPTQHYPDADPPHPIPLPVRSILGAIAVAFLLVAVPGAVSGERRLLKNGRPAPALVTGAKRPFFGIFTLYVVSYEFPLPSGETCKGSKIGDRMTEGTVTCVLYDPANPRRNVLYPCSLVRLSGR